MGWPSALKMCLSQVSNVKAPRERGSWEVTNINDNRMHLGHLKWWLAKIMPQRSIFRIKWFTKGPLIYKGIKRSQEVELWSKCKRGKHLQATIACFLVSFARQSNLTLRRSCVLHHINSSSMAMDASKGSRDTLTIHHLDIMTRLKAGILSRPSYLTS
jgi:hypothetical protein